MNKIEILNSLESSFSNLSYPYQRDFYQAIAHRDYEDYVDLGKEKKWDEVTKAELNKYYDFIFFLDQDAAAYYLPTYIKLMLENSESKEEDHRLIDMCADTLWLLLLMPEFDFQILDTNQLHIVSSFLIYCRDVLDPIFDLDTEVLHEALKHLDLVD